jgi:site-specific recombinase XerD
MLRLEWRDVNLEKKMITVRETKNNEIRYVPMSDTVQQVLSRHPHVITGGSESLNVFTDPDGTPYNSIRRAYQSALKHSRLGHHTIHDLRHTFASQLVMAGVDLRTVAKLMGHRTIQVTMRYAHLAPDHLRSAVERLDDAINGATKSETKTGSIPPSPS